MSKERIKSQLDQVKNQVIFSNTRINYLLQIIDLSIEKNRIVMRLQGLFAMIVRDFGARVVISIRALYETKDNTHNINTLIKTISSSSISDEKKSLLKPVLDELSQLANEDLPREVTIIASTTEVHKSLKLPKKEIRVKYTDMSEHLDKIGKLLNDISGILWKSSTLMYMPDSEGDSFSREMNHIEIAEDIGTWMLRSHSDHEVVIKRKEFIAKMKEKSKHDK